MSADNGEQAAPTDLTPSLVAHLREGRDEAGALLDGLYRERLVRFCTSYLRKRGEAEDLVQDVFLRVFESDAVPDNFRAWIYKICRNRCLDVLRARSRRRDDQPLPDEAVRHADVTGYLTRLVRDERQDHLRRLLGELTAEQREVLALRYDDGLSRAEVAEVLEISEKLVKSRLFHGLEKLRSHDSLARDA